MDNIKEIIVNKEVAYEYVENPYYYITKTGVLYSSYIHGAHGNYDLKRLHRVVYGQDKDGYYRCVLSFHSKHKYIKIHQIMAIQFLGYKQYETELVINHIDGNKQNNNLINLELVTVKENNHHAWRTGLITKNSNPSTIKVDVYDNYTDTIYHFNSIQEVMQSNINVGCRYINHIRNNEINFNLCLFKKNITGCQQTDYNVSCYYNGLLFKTFANVREAGKYFNRPSNTVSSAFKAKRSREMNRYTLTFPNVSTIENIAV